MESVGDAHRPASVPPPGWTGGSRPAAPAPAAPAPAAPAAGTEPADAAVRWRQNAAVIDNLLVYVGYLAVCAVLHWRPVAPQHIWLAFVLGVVYHFAQEARDGTTVGKRHFGIRVVAADGGRPTPAGIAIRNVLRIVDAFPACYMSGLITMWHTGPARRQRIGDILGKTKVVAVEGRAAEKGTPAYGLPLACLAATVASALVVLAAVHSGQARQGAVASSPVEASPSFRASFVVGCDRTSHGAMDCGCVLDRLEQEGYTTYAQYQQLAEQIRFATLAHDRSRLPAAFVSAALACRR